MPNHIKNIISITAKLDRVNAILSEIQNDERGIGSLDFNKLIPMPESLNIESGSRTNKGIALYREFLTESLALAAENLINGVSEKQESKSVQNLCDKYAELTKDDPEVMILGKQACYNIEKYGCPTWYEWSNTAWDTKWNAYDFGEYSGGSAISFSTAWSSVPKILTVLSEKYPDVQFDYSWADEDIGYNVGKSTYQNGEVTDSYMPVGGSREAYELAADIKECDLAQDYNLHLSEDETTYEYKEDDELEV